MIASTILLYEIVTDKGNDWKYPSPVFMDLEYIVEKLKNKRYRNRHEFFYKCFLARLGIETTSCK